MATYRKLSGHRRGVGGYSRLWLADDHVLLVTSSGYSEEYRRFYFSDIQALFLRTTRWRAGVNWTFGGLAALFGGLGFTVPNPGALFLWTTALICGAIVGFNTAFGPTCLVEIQTGVARHPLAPLQRVRTSRKVIARLLPLIQAAQGELAPEQLAQITTPAAAVSAPVRATP